MPFQKSAFALIFFWISQCPTPFHVGATRVPVTGLHWTGRSEHFQEAVGFGDLPVPFEEFVAFLDELGDDPPSSRVFSGESIAMPPFVDLPRITELTWITQRC
jgi:hypothetical protein